MLDDIKRKKRDVSFIAKICMNLPEAKRQFMLGIAIGVSAMPKKNENQATKVTG